jgi:DNA-binding response OmpR family regulator
VKVLVADDDEDLRALMAAVLVEAGHEVVEVGDGAAAWAAYQRAAPALVVLDWQMPELSGLDVCARIRREAPWRGAVGESVGPVVPTFVLMVTARGQNDDLRLVLDAGADDYLSKPLTPDALATRVVIAERRMAAEHARLAAEDALRRAQWLAGIGETAIAVQHEINNPLTALLGHTMLLQSGVVGAEEERESIRVIAEQGARIGDVVKRLANLRDPHSVEYLRGTRMLDLSKGKEGQ